MKGHIVKVTIPDVDQMTDDELALFAHMRDGRWSRQTKALMLRFKTDKLNLNRAWAGTSQTWVCPCCDRDKLRIVRLTSSGVLLCQLELHHDHLGDKAGKHFEEVNQKTEDRDFNIQVSHAKQAMLQFVERFERTLICIDCNLAEGKAKKSLGDEMNPDFTFSPKEIASFVRVADNRVHEVDLAAVKAMWQRIKPDIADRLDFAQRMAKRFANGKNRREVVAGTRADLWMEDRNIIWNQVANAFPPLQRGDSIGWRLVARSTSRDAVGRSTRSKVKAAGKPPADAEFAALEVQNADQKHWMKTGDDWTCGCCKRSKRDICRVSNKRRWTARIHVMRDWIFDDNDPAAMYWRTASGDRIIVDHVAVLVCQDCRHVVAEVQRMDDSIDQRSLTVGDISEAIVAISSNHMHEVDYEFVKRRAYENSDLLSAVKDYQEHENEARYYLGRVRGFAESHRCTMDEAQDHFAYEHAKAIDVDLAEGHAFMNWMIAEGRRFEDRWQQE